MASHVDLNRLRDQIKENRLRGNTNPEAGKTAVYVNPQGRIELGASERPRQGLSVIRQDVFSFGLLSRLSSRPPSSPRARRELETVTERFPPGTRYLTVDGVSGWFYSVVDELGNSYQFFAYFSGSRYEIQLVFPDVVSEDPAHLSHIYDSGRLCLSKSGVWPKSLAEAYAKSVLWANGYGVLRETGKFPF